MVTGGGDLFTGDINLGVERHSRFRVDSEKYRNGTDSTDVK